MTNPFRSSDGGTIGGLTVLAHVLMICTGMGCVTFLAAVGKVDGSTAVVVIVAALGITGQTVGRPPHPPGSHSIQVPVSNG